MLVVEQYFRTGVLVYLWSKYLWQQILERRQRNILNAYKTPPIEIREIIQEEEYENRRVAALHRSGFQVFKSTLDVGVATGFILWEGFRKIWDKSSEMVAYFNIEDSNSIIKNALFLTMLTSGMFLLNLPVTMLEIYSRQLENVDKKLTVTSILLDHCVAQTLLFPFVCLFIVAFKIGGNDTMLWVFGFAEFQLLNDLLLDMEPAIILPSGDLRSELVETAKTYQFPLHDIFVAQRLNRQKLVNLAGFPRVRNIVLSKELTIGESVDGQYNFTTLETNALVARELSHWNRCHPFLNFLLNQTHLCLHLYTMHRFLISEKLYEAFHFENRPLAVGLTLLAYCPLFDLYNLIAKLIRRKLEFIADEDVKKIHGHIYLKTAIIKITKMTKSFPIQDPLYSLCQNSEASCYERINALNEYHTS